MINEDLDLTLPKGRGKEAKTNEDSNGKIKENEKKEKDVHNVLSKGEFLADLDLHTIAREFSKFSVENRTLLVPIGFPQAGKSLLLSSLLYYAIKGNDNLFRVLIEEGFPYNKGRKTVDEMVRFFESGRLYETTAIGTLDLIGLRIEPSGSKRPILNLALLDLAGEDIKSIKRSGNAAFTDKINAVFNGLSVDDSPIIFVLITPFIPPIEQGESIDDAHNREDALLFDFLNYIDMNQRQILKNSKYFVIVSQWDKNPNQDQKIDDFIRTKRRSVFGYVKDTDVIWGQYSVGKLLVSKINNVEIQEIVRINYDYPSRFWKKLYQICTNKSLENETFFKKLFS